MDHKLVLKNSSSAAVNTMLNTIIYLKAIKDLHIRLEDFKQSERLSLFDCGNPQTSN